MQNFTVRLILKANFAKVTTVADQIGFDVIIIFVALSFGRVVRRPLPKHQIHQIRFRTSSKCSLISLKLIDSRRIENCLLMSCSFGCFDRKLSHLHQSQLALIGLDCFD